MHWHHRYYTPIYILALLTRHLARGAYTLLHVFNGSRDQTIKAIDNLFKWFHLSSRLTLSCVSAVCVPVGKSEERKRWRRDQKDTA